MARIIENNLGRRIIKVNTDDILSIIKEYQRVLSLCDSAKETREILDKSNFYLPEEV